MQGGTTQAKNTCNTWEEAGAGVSSVGQMCRGRTVEEQDPPLHFLIPPADLTQINPS